MRRGGRTSDPAPTAVPVADSTGEQQDEEDDQQDGEHASSCARNCLTRNAGSGGTRLHPRVVHSPAVGRRCPIDLEILTPTGDLVNATAQPLGCGPSPGPRRAVLGHRRSHHRRLLAASATAIAVGLVSTLIAVRDLRSGVTVGRALPAALVPRTAIHLVTPVVCQPRAQRLQALDTLLQAAVDAARDVQDDLDANDPVSASEALRYLRIYIDDAQATEGCGIDLHPPDVDARDA